MKFLKTGGFFWLLLISVIFVSLYVYRLDALPTSVHGDESETALQAIKTIGDHKIYGVGWAQLPLAAYWPYAAIMYLFGQNVVGDRLGSVFFGLLTLPFFYLLLLRYYGRTAAVIGTVLLGTSHMWIAMSRVGIIYTQAASLLVITVYVLLQAFRKNTLWYFILSGFCFGAAMYSYYAVRMLPLLVAYLAGSYFLRSETRKRAFRNIAIFICTAFIVYLPQGIYFLQHPDEFMNRTQSVYIFSPSVYGGLNPKPDLRQVVSKQLADTFNIFAGDTGGQYGYPGQLLDYITLLFFFLGVVYAFKKISVMHTFFFFWLFLCIAVQVVTTSPSAIFLPRFVVGLPVFYIFVTLGVLYLMKVKPARIVVYFLVGACIGINVYTYFVLYPGRVSGDINARTATRVAGYLNAYPHNGDGNVQAVFLTEPNLYANSSIMRLLSPHSNAININNPAAYVSDLSRTGGSRDETRKVFIIHPEYSYLISDLVAAYPGAGVKPFKDVDASILFYVIETPGNPDQSIKS
jgi:4-amino-4-deoxy-L-arabinose transferase-like glycosyltransferase